MSNNILKNGNRLQKYKMVFESIRLGSMDFELRFKDAIEQMSTRK
jgi:hypothetical protein